MNATRKGIRSWVYGALVSAAIGVRGVWSRLRGRGMEVADYTMLEPWLYLGGRCERPPAGTRAVLNVSPNRDEFSVEEYRWRPVLMSAAPTVEWLREQVEFIESCRAGEKIVFVHCDAGVDRSATVVIAYFMWKRGWGRDEALGFVQRKRAVVRPNAVFMALLGEWGRSGTWGTQ